MRRPVAVEVPSVSMLGAGGTSTLIEFIGLDEMRNHLEAWAATAQVWADRHFPLTEEVSAWPYA